MSQSQALISPLAEFPEIRSARSPVCTEYLERILQRTDQFSTISVIGMDGYTACGAITPQNLLYLKNQAAPLVRSTERKIFSGG